MRLLFEIDKKDYDPDGKDKKHHTCIIEEYRNETIQ